MSTFMFTRRPVNPAWPQDRQNFQHGWTALFDAIMDRFPGRDAQDGIEILAIRTLAELDEELGRPASFSVHIGS